MKGGWSRPLGYVAIISVVAGSYFLGVAGRGDDTADSAVTTSPDPGYAARDAEVIETGFDGRERYRLNARVIRQQSETGAIDLEDLRMDYHPGAQARIPGEKPASGAEEEVWNLKSDRGQVAQRRFRRVDGNLS